jgi:membrane protease YdiL (CAAX protease family)
MTDDLPPMVTRVEPAVPALPRPGLLAAAVLTFGYWLALIGGMAVVVIVALFFVGKPNEAPVEGATDIQRMPPAMRAALAWSFPAGYFCGLVFSLVVIRRVVGPGWTREFGLHRLPAVHLLLGFLALPGFILLSDALARFVQPVDAFAYRVTGIREIDLSEPLRAIFESFHWSFAVLAIGVGPGVVEELWCRGFLGCGLIGRHGAWLGVALSSMFFGLLHLWPPSYVIVTAAMGACLHFAYLTSRSLWVPITMHLTNNGFAGLAATGTISLHEVEAGVAANQTAVAVGAAAALLMCGYAMWRLRTR